MGSCQSILPSTDVMQLTLTLEMTTAQVVETSVTVNKNSPLQDYVHPDDQTQPTFGSKNYTGVVIFRRSKTTKSRSINFLLCVYRK